MSFLIPKSSIWLCLQKVQMEAGEPFKLLHKGFKLVFAGDQGSPLTLFSSASYRSPY